MWNAKNEKCIAGRFASRFAFCAPFFAFRISHQGWHTRKNSEDFVVYFFAALIKHEIRMKCEKCIVSVSYFVVCFVKNTLEMRKVYSWPKASHPVLVRSFHWIYTYHEIMWCNYRRAGSVFVWRVDDSPKYGTIVIQKNQLNLSFLCSQIEFTKICTPA